MQQFQLGTIFPSCCVVLQWTDSENMQRLRHKVEIKGAKEPMNYIFLDYAPQTTGRCKATFPRVVACVYIVLIQL